MVTKSGQPKAGRKKAQTAHKECLLGSKPLGHSWFYIVSAGTEPIDLLVTFERVGPADCRFDPAPGC